MDKVTLKAFDEEAIKRACADGVTDIEIIEHHPFNTVDIRLMAKKELVYTGEDNIPLSEIDRHCLCVKEVTFLCKTVKQIPGKSLLSVTHVIYKKYKDIMATLPILFPFIIANPQLTSIVLWSVLDIDFGLLLTNLPSLKQLEVNNKELNDNIGIQFSWKRRMGQMLSLEKLLLAFSRSSQAQFESIFGPKIKFILAISPKLKTVGLENCQVWGVPSYLKNRVDSVVVIEHSIQSHDNNIWLEHNYMSLLTDNGPVEHHYVKTIDSNVSND